VGIGRRGQDLIAKANHGGDAQAAGDNAGVGGDTPGGEGDAAQQIAGSAGEVGGVEIAGHDDGRDDQELARAASAGQGAPHLHGHGAHIGGPGAQVGVAQAFEFTGLLFGGGDHRLGG